MKNELQANEAAEILSEILARLFPLDGEWIKYGERVTDLLAEKGYTITSAEPAAPLSDDVDTHINSLYNDALSSRDGYGNAHDDANAIRAHISALEADLSAYVDESFERSKEIELLRGKKFALEAENKRLRDALAYRFNNDWSGCSEAVEKALKEVFATQRGEIMEALAKSDGKAGE